MKAAVQYITLITLSLLQLASSLNITNPPQNVTVCINDRAEINCGFTGENPKFVIPNWIIFNNGSIANNETILGSAIASNRVSGLQWVADLDSGVNNASNSRLLFGPVNKTHNQSSFQCVFVSPVNYQILATSSIGTITVVGPPSVNITIDEVCIASITLSLTIYSHSACEASSLLVNLMSSDRTISQVSNNDSTYTFDGLAPNTSYNVIVTVFYDSGINDSQVFNGLARTRSSSAPNPVDVGSIDMSSTNTDNLRIAWKAPSTDICLMSEAVSYSVNFSCDNNETISDTTSNTAITFSPPKLLSNTMNVSCIITIVAINNEGMSSQPSSEVFVYPVISDDDDYGDDGSSSGNGTNNRGASSDDNDAAAIIAGVVSPIVVIIVIIIVLCLICYCYKKNKKGSVLKKTAGKNRQESYSNTNGSEVVAYASITGQGTISTAVSASGLNPMMTMQVTTQSSSNRPSDNGNKTIHNNNTESAPPLSVYADLQLANDMPKSVNLDKHVPYAKIKPV